MEAYDFLKIFTEYLAAQGVIEIGTRTKFQLEILNINVISSIIYFHEIILESSRNVSKKLLVVVLNLMLQLEYENDQQCEPQDYGIHVFFWNRYARPSETLAAAYHDDINRDIRYLFRFCKFHNSDLLV